MENRILNNRYKLEAEIGRGGMGMVYRAIDTQLHRTVAIKILPPEFVHNTQFLARFNSEIKNTSQLKHDNIVSIYDVGVDDNTNYYVMDYIDGQDLKAYLAQHGRLTVEEISQILSPIAAAMDYAHGQDIVHRDIKPENIIIDRQGVPWLTDFGIARSLEGTRMTTGMIGTPEYASPEQAKGEDVCGRSDQYSLAIVAYEMLTGTTPFRSSTSQPWAMGIKHINELPADPRTIVADLDSNAADAVMTGLAKNVDKRHSTCVKFVEAMQLTKANARVKAALPAKKLLIIPLVLVGILCLSGAIFLFVGGNKSKPAISENSNTSPSPTVVTPPPPAPLKTNPKDGAEMILIPAGEFLMGTSEKELAALLKANKREWFTDEMPQHKVYLDAYYMYKTEVTVAQYRKFCTTTNRKMPTEPDWKWQDTHPIVNVSWDDATAYADWAGVALPTEAQWEKAARGGDGRIYPWGNTWDETKCANWMNSGEGKGANSVGSFPTGDSPYGVMDMAGNVEELCADWYGADYYKNAPVKNHSGPATGDIHSLRGGSWGSGGFEGGYDYYCRGAYRDGYSPFYNGGSIYYFGDVGFRCASPVP